MLPRSRDGRWWSSIIPKQRGSTWHSRLAHDGAVSDRRGDSVHPQAVPLGEAGFDLLDRLARTDGIFEDLGARRHRREVRPAFRLPELRALERLSAMQEALLDLDADAEPGVLVLHLHRPEQVRIARDPGAAVDAQRLLAAR